MSDDEFMMDDALEEEDYDFEYEDEDEDQDGDAHTENKYYNAKGFKALKQQTKINFHRGLYENALRTYRRLLLYTKSAVTRNYAEKSVNSILDYVSASTDATLEMLELFYTATNEALSATQSDRLGTKTNLKLARLWLARREWGRLATVLSELRTQSFASIAGDGQSQGTMMLELLALEMQMYREMGNVKKLKETYDASLRIKNAIPHPRTMGVIRECGGKMHMEEKQWEDAQVDFFQAFRNYDEAGSPQRIQVLKYLVLAHMLMGNDINPFDSQETKPYREDPNVVAMTDLVDAYQQRDVLRAERIIAQNQRTLTDDPFIRAFLADVLGELRTQFLLDYLLHVPMASIELHLLKLIHSGRIDGTLDQPAQTLELVRCATPVPLQQRDAERAWAVELTRLGGAISGKAASSLRS
ncbi:hypothetical protein MSPP1_002726 [Malassezia sp. CBS 17886]|nr:hypothetical protein MSPP1_002726 [Malassezia sp. CBS 17886]